MTRLLAIACFLLASAAAAQPAEVTIEIDERRPLVDLAEKLQKRYPITVTFEEGPWEYPLDLEAVDGTVPTVLPRKVAVTFRYLERDPPDYRDLLTVLLRQYEAADGPGKFRLEVGSERYYHVIQEQMRERTGQLVNVAPLLSTKVHLEDAERTINDTIDAIVIQLNKSSPIPVRYGFFPLNLFNQNRVRLAADGVPARDVMRQAVENLPYRTGWRVEYNLTCKCYVLGFTLGPGPEYKTFPW